MYVLPPQKLVPSDVLEREAGAQMPRMVGGQMVRHHGAAEGGDGVQVGTWRQTCVEPGAGALDCQRPSAGVEKHRGIGGISRARPRQGQLTEGDVCPDGPIEGVLDAGNHRMGRIAVALPEHIGGADRRRRLGCADSLEHPHERAGVVEGAGERRAAGEVLQQVFGEVVAAELLRCPPSALLTCSRSSV